MSFGEKCCSSFPKGPLLLLAEANRRTESQLLGRCNQPNMLPINLVCALFLYQVQGGTESIIKK